MRSLRPVLGDPSFHDECGGKSVGSGQVACVVSLLHPPPLSNQPIPRTAFAICGSY